VGVPLQGQLWGKYASAGNHAVSRWCYGTAQRTKRLERAAETRKTHRNNLFATLKDQGFEAREPTEEEKANHKYATTQDPIWLEGELEPFADVAEELNEGKDERGY
jgi:hypothetical protein